MVSRSGDTFTIQAEFASDLAIGESVCVSGICLTVTGVSGDTFDVDVSPTTVSLTTAGGWEQHPRVNLERALALGDPLGGHIVTGHVDGVGRLLERVPLGNSERLHFSAPANFAAHFIAEGSVAVDGVSLTLNEILDEPGGGVSFWVTIIPQTSAHTTLADRAVQDGVNLETDVLGKYVERVLALRGLALEPAGRS